MTKEEVLELIAEALMEASSNIDDLYQDEMTPSDISHAIWKAGDAARTRAYIED